MPGLSFLCEESDTLFEAPSMLQVGPRLPGDGAIVKRQMATLC
jgi:hypothetical protein